jgi:hypothetical protein
LASSLVFLSVCYLLATILESTLRLLS